VDLTGSTFLVVVVELVQSSHGSAEVVVAGATFLVVVVVVVVDEVQSSHGAASVVVDSQAMAEEARRVVAKTAEVALTMVIVVKRVTYVGSERMTGALRETRDEPGANESNERRDTKVEWLDCSWNRGREERREEDDAM